MTTSDQAARWLRLIALLSLCLVVVAAGCARGPSLHYVDGGIEARGIDRGSYESARAALEGDAITTGSVERVLSLHVESKANPPVSGRYSIDTTARRIRFEPTFPLDGGIDYVARLEVPGRDDLELRFDLPSAPVPEIRTEVVAVYPSGERLPANLLRFYIHFSAPMRRGDSYRHIEIQDEQGEPLNDTFLELEQELWDPAGLRLTVLFDPGRIKSGLLPTRTLGGALTESRRLKLVVDSMWPDANGIQLARDFEHEFAVGAADHRLPQPADWTVSVPQEGTRAPLTLALDEPLDHAQLQSMIVIERETGEAISGVVAVSSSETLWTLAPDEPWASGTYRARIDSRLEDRAGNRIDRPFERDLRDPGSSALLGAESEPFQFISFEISNRPS